MATLAEIQALFKGGKHEEAIIAVWTEVSEERRLDDPEIPALCLIRAQCHLRLQQLQEAKEWAQKAGDNAEARQILVNLRILEQTALNLERGRATATGIGVFAGVKTYRGEDGSPAQQPTPCILLRRRQEEGSLFGVDLSGKWELPGGGVELKDFEQGDYLSAVISALVRELREETGLEFRWKPSDIPLQPAWILNPERGTIDLAFVTVLLLPRLRETDDFAEKMRAGEVRWFLREELGRIEVVSPRMMYLIHAAFEPA